MRDAILSRQKTNSFWYNSRRSLSLYTKQHILLFHPKDNEVRHKFIVVHLGCHQNRLEMHSSPFIRNHFIQTHCHSLTRNQISFKQIGPKSIANHQESFHSTDQTLKSNPSPSLAIIPSKEIRLKFITSTRGHFIQRDWTYIYYCTQVIISSRLIRNQNADYSLGQMFN